MKTEDYGLTWNEAIPFIVMMLGVILLGTGAIWQMVRQYNYHREMYRKLKVETYESHR